jgi:hypothetical protein
MSVKAELLGRKGTIGGAREKAVGVGRRGSKYITHTHTHTHKDSIKKPTK